MKRSGVLQRLPRIALAMVLVATASLGGGPETFERDPRRAFARARETGRPLLIDFHTAWCAACERMRKTTWPEPDVRRRLERFVALTVDGERNRNLQQRYAVESYPTLVVAEPGGQPVLILSGFQSPRALTAHLDSILERWEELATWARRAHGGRRDAAATVDLADFALAREALASAESLYRRALARKRTLEPERRDRARRGLGRALAATGRCREALRALEGDPLAEEVRRHCAAVDEE